jgi:hypothetical protein
MESGGRSRARGTLSAAAAFSSIRLDRRSEAMARAWKGTFAAFLAGGVAGVFVAPVVAPALGRAARPAAKAAIKAGMALYRRGQETAAELREAFEDVSAEIAAEGAGPKTGAEEPVASAADVPSAESPQPGAAIH